MRNPLLSALIIILTACQPGMPQPSVPASVEANQSAASISGPVSATTPITAMVKPVPAFDPHAIIEPDDTSPPGGLEEPLAPAEATVEPGQAPDAVELTALAIATPVEPSQSADSVDAIFIQDRYAYINYGSNLVILELSDSVQMVTVGLVALPPNTYASAIYVLDQYAYVMAAGLRIFDISNPAQPTEVGSFQPPQRHWTGYTTMASPPPPPPRGMDVVVRHADAGRTYAYVAASAAGLRIVDVSDPTTPVEIGFHEFKPATTATGIAVDGNVAYLATQDGLRIMDVARPTQPVELATLPAASWDVAVAGDRAYLVEGYCSSLDGCIFGGLQVVGVSNPTSPGRISQTSLIYSQVVALAGGNIYVGTRYGLVALQQTNLSQPVGYWPPASSMLIKDIAVKDEYLYLATGDSGLKILNAAEVITPSYTTEPQTLN